ncbi:MAG: ribonuclease P protein component [Oryzihumus sp.]
MLPQPNRLTTSAEFARATRRGRRCARPALVVHLWVGTVGEGGDPPRAGFVVSKGVGGAVVRNTVTRRLRGVVRPRLDRLPAGSLLVVRALPPAAGAPSSTLAAELDDCLQQLCPARAGAGPRGVSP